MGRSRTLLTAIVTFALLAPATAASARTVFRPRVGPALGLLPPVSGPGKLKARDVATGSLTPETYHGGSVMAGGVTVHTVFWAPAGYAFQGSPGGSVPTYVALIQQYFTDIAHDSGAGGNCTSSGCNGFSVLPQYAEGTSVGQIIPGAYSISYNPASDSIADTDPYPAKSMQCASPQGTSTCVTDGQVQSEIDHLIQTGAGPRGLNNLWFVFLPPNVDECIVPGMCGTNSFAGYHSVSNVGGHGVAIYALAIDPFVEGPVPSGADPQGYPDAEIAINIAAHETIEAMTDPEGAGWMDPNGAEVGDKCESPQNGSPLGFAPNGSPYNQVVNGHQYLLQEMWANLDSGGNPGCVQATSTTSNQLPLPQVNLRQFNPILTGNVNRVPGGGIGVKVSLLRAGPGTTPVVVARASTTTAANGSWSVSLAPHAPGDDRDEIDVDYSGANAPQPSHQVILTGNGGNPYTEAGWTGWTALDIGSALTAGPSGSTLTLAPCFQSGSLSYNFDGPRGAVSPTDFCNTQTDSATVGTALIGPADTLTATSNDNRAFAAPDAPTPNPLGGLVSLTVPLGEAGSVSAFTNPLSPTFFTPTGMPQCIADLEVQAVECIGLVSNATYTISNGRVRQRDIADSTGTVIVPLPVAGGNLVSLSNGSRTLTVLHVARLRVVLNGDETVLAGGRCQPGEYYGAPPTTVPVTSSAGLPTNVYTGGTALTGTICPMNGDASGLPTTQISQTDERSGGQTQTEVPDVVDTSPIEGETVYGKFTVLAESGLPGPNNSLIPTDPVSSIAVSITPASGGAPVFTARNVDTLNGVTAGPLRVGNYIATWTLTDANGDVRVGQTRFIERAGLPGSTGTGISCRLTGKAHNQIRCSISFANTKASGTVRVRITRGGRVVALGQGKVKGGKATVTMRRLRRVSRGAWRVTLVLSQPHKRPQTTVLTPATLF